MTRIRKPRPNRFKAPAHKPRTRAALAARVSGGLHRPAPLRQQPHTPISRWQLFVVVGQNGGRTRHLVGCADGEGRVSSPIVAIDARTRTAKSASGRDYFLVGESGFDFTAGYVFQAWLQGTGTTVVRESSDALDRLLLQHNPMTD